MLVDKISRGGFESRPYLTMGIVELSRQL